LLGDYYGIDFPLNPICVEEMLTSLINYAHFVEIRKRRQPICFSAAIKLCRFGGNPYLG